VRIFCIKDFPEDVKRVHLIQESSEKVNFFSLFVLQIISKKNMDSIDEE